MNQHTFLTRINDTTFNDLQLVKGLSNQSINSLLNEGARLVVSAKKEQIAIQNRSRNTLQGMTETW